jgi:hypothetical protein
MVSLLEGAIMLRQYFVAIALILLFTSNASSALAGDESAEQAVYQAAGNYCRIEFDGAWVEDRWAVIKLSDKRKDERKYREVTDSAVFELGKHYPFIVVTSYDIREVNLRKPTRATAKIAYRRVAHSESKTGKHWYLVADRLDDDLVTLILVFEKNKWLVLDPPPPRVSKEFLLEYYEYRVKEYSAMWEEKLNDPTYDEEQKANVRASRDQATNTVRILKNAQ